MRAYCHPARVEFAWLDVASPEQVCAILYPSLISLWDRCGVLIERQRAELRQALHAFKQSANILGHLVDASSKRYASGRVLPLTAERNTPFMTCHELVKALDMSNRVEWPVLVSQLSDSGDLVILQHSRDRRIG